MAATGKRGGGKWKRPGLSRASAKVQVVETTQQGRVPIPAASSCTHSLSDEENNASTPTPNEVIDLTPIGLQLTASDNPPSSQVQAVKNSLPVDGQGTTASLKITETKKATQTVPQEREQPPSKKAPAKKRAKPSKNKKKSEAANDAEVERDGGDTGADDNTNPHQKRMVYRAKENCLVMQVVLGDHGIFHRGEKESKAECWVKITERLAAVLNRKLSPDSLRKHINKLEKAYKKEANADRARSGIYIVEPVM